MSADAQLEFLDNMWAARPFLAREFLLWLWHRIDTTGGKIIVQTGGKKKNIKLWLEEKLSFESSKGFVQRQSLIGTHPAKSSEANVSLAAGKFPTEMRLALELPDIGVCRGTLSARRTGISGFAPAENEYRQTQSETPSEEVISHVGCRLEHMHQFTEIYEGLVAMFLRERTSDSWENEVSTQISHWMRHRASSVESTDSLH